MRLTRSEMAELLMAQARMKRAYINDHSGGKDTRPSWVLDLARRDLAVLEQAADDYARAAEKERNAA